MKRRLKPGKLSLSKRPNDQKLIETFLLLNQAKTEIKSNDTKTDKTKENVKKIEIENNNENKSKLNIIEDNKKKEPIYYGIHLEIETEKKLLESLQNSINLILSEHKEEFNSIYETLTELIKRYNKVKEGNEDNNSSNKIIEVNKMKYPKSFHITTIFGGRKGFDKNSKPYQEFCKGKEVEFKILGAIIVPQKMVVIPVKA